MGTDRQRAVRNGRGRGGSFQTIANPFETHTDVTTRARIARSAKAPAAIDAALDSGLAIIVGRTKDGGAVSLTLLAGEERHRTYCATQEELDEAFAAILRMVAATARAIRQRAGETEEPFQKASD
jgi:hypothetical protein